MSRPQCPYEYDNAGRFLKITNAIGASEHFVYDSIGNLIAQKADSANNRSIEGDYIQSTIRNEPKKVRP